jgi:hypothetical protein
MGASIGSRCRLSDLGGFRRSRVQSRAAGYDIPGATPRAVSAEQGPIPRRGGENRTLVTELGEKPNPQIEPAEPPPGGVDAVEDVEYDEQPVVPDVWPIGNTALREGGVPDGVTEPEDTDQGASSDGASDPEKETPV